MNLWVRAGKGLNLTPGERAFRKLVIGFLMTGGVAAFTTAAQLLATSGRSIDWRFVGVVSAVAGVIAIANAVSKWFTAQGDAPLADLTAQVAHTLAGYVPPLRLPIMNSAASVPVVGQQGIQTNQEPTAAT